MQSRNKMKPRTSRKVFKKGVDRTHKFNKQTTVKRGGIRL